MDVVITKRTDKPFLDACKAWSELQDALHKVFWISNWKLRIFGRTALSRKHSRLLEAIRVWGEALVECELNNPNRKNG